MWIYIFFFEKTGPFGFSFQTAFLKNQVRSVWFSVICSFLLSFLKQSVISFDALSLLLCRDTSFLYFLSARCDKGEFFEFQYYHLYFIGNQLLPPSYDISQHVILFTKQYTHSTKKYIKIQPKSMDL